jgi:uncharacterized protein (UPF0210 family)
MFASLSRNNQWGGRMVKHRRVGLAAAAVLMLIATTGHAQTYTKPNVRAITAFVRLDRATFDRQIADALIVLHAAEDKFAQRGYKTETLRIVTQPLGELIHEQSDDEALRLLKAIDDLSAKRGFIPSVGPAMMRDSDDPHVMRLLEKALSTLPNLQANSIIAAEDGIHWNVIRESAALVRYLTDHGPPSHGNFNFTATAMMKPYGPFYPGAYHTGAGMQFSIGFEGANVVQEVFARTHGNFDKSVAELTQQLTIHARVADLIGSQVAASS